MVISFPERVEKVCPADEPQEEAQGLQGKRGRALYLCKSLLPKQGPKRPTKVLECPKNSEGKNLHSKQSVPRFPCATCSQERPLSAGFQQSSLPCPQALGLPGEARGSSQRAGGRSGFPAHRFGFVEVRHLDVAPVMAAEVGEVDGEAHPEVKAGGPGKDCVLEAGCEVRVLCIPRQVPVLGKSRDQTGKGGKTGVKFYQFGRTSPKK